MYIITFCQIQWEYVRFDLLPFLSMTSLFVHVEVESIKMKHLALRKMFCYIESMSSPRMITKTLKLRIKERHAKVLQMMASQVNQVRRSRMP